MKKRDDITVYFFKDYFTDKDGVPAGELQDLFSYKGQLYYIEKDKETVDEAISKIKEHFKGQNVNIVYSKPPQYEQK